jgi:hypothetical protein
MTVPPPLIAANRSLLMALVLVRSKTADTRTALS